MLTRTNFGEYFGADVMSKPRVMYILNYFPSIVESYMQVEIEALRDEYEIRVICSHRAEPSIKDHHPFLETTDTAQIIEAIKEFRPHVLHGHWLHQVGVLSGLAKHTQTPF